MRDMAGSIKSMEVKERWGGGCGATIKKQSAHRKSEVCTRIQGLLDAVKGRQN